MQNSRCFLSFKKEDNRTKQAVFRGKKKLQNCIENNLANTRLKNQNEFHDLKRNLKPTNKEKTIKH